MAINPSVQPASPPARQPASQPASQSHLPRPTNHPDRSTHPSIHLFIHPSIVSLSKTLYPLLNTGSTQEETWLKNCWLGHKASTQTSNTHICLSYLKPSIIWWRLNSQSDLKSHRTLTVTIHKTISQSNQLCLPHQDNCNAIYCSWRN